MGILNRLKQTVKFLIDISKEDPKAPFKIVSQNNITAGDESYHNGNFIVKGNGFLKIGNYCAFGSNITVILSNHNISYPSMQYTFYRKNFKQLPYETTETKVWVGSDVWIGDNVLILPNVTIGNGVVIGGGSVVTKNIEPFSIVAGNPARVIRKRFSPDKIIELENLKWWEWDKQKIQNNKNFFFTIINE